MATIELGADDDGAAVAARVGDTIRLRLADNPTTGYRWELEPMTGGSVDEAGYGYESDSQLAGSAGVATWVFGASQPGQAEIRLKRWRPWEGDSSVLARLAVTIDVAD